MSFAYAAALTYTPGKMYVICGCPDTENTFHEVQEFTKVGSSYTWTSRTGPATNGAQYRAQLAGCKLGVYGYIFGGGDAKIDDKADVTNRFVDRYTPPGTWLARTGFAAPGRCDFQALVLDSKAYLIGGQQDNGDALTDVDEYTENTDAWVEKGAMVSPARRAYTGGVAGGKGYVAAGINTANATIRDTDEYTQGTDSWASKTDIPTPARGNATGFVLSDILYAVCGKNSGLLQDVDAYTAATDTWGAKTNFPDAGRAQHGAAVMGNLGYIQGGIKGTTRTTGNYEYNPTTDVWTEVSQSVPTPRRFGHTAVTI